MKTMIWFLVGGGALFLLLGAGFGSTWLAVFGTVMVIYGVGIAFKKLETLQKEAVIDNWSTLIEGGAGKAERIFKDTQEMTQATKAPGLKLERRRLAPGVMRGIAGERREFLVCTDLRSAHLAPYQIVLNARDYGTNLAIDWHLTYRPPLWKAAVSLLLTKVNMENPLLELDLFDQQDLRAYVTNTHHCLLRAVENFMLSMEQDPSKIERRSRGLLGIS